uniref:Integrin beta n=1 Tax=Globodera pallida TaxID=36090 RepID=A0A183BHL6_GLOPA
MATFLPFSIPSATVGAVTLWLISSSVCFLPRASAQLKQEGAADDGEIIMSEPGFPCHSLSQENYTCSGCIQLHDSCAWCMDFSFNNLAQYSRCDSPQTLLEHGCAPEQIVNPASTLRNLLNEPFTDGTEEGEHTVQLRPQEVEIRIRPKSKARFHVRFRQPHDYPVDLYYLMDLSYSMKDDKEKLSQLGDLLAERMRSITKNFRLGFGSFIDKKVMPFVDPRREKQEQPCAEGCAPTYGFRHQMSLTSNTAKFAKEVDKAQISGNLDAPEGGFDAVMQAISCNSSIGWRERSRKMIVFSTDAGFHFAGDGRLAGITTPNDGQCHLDSDGYYTKSTEQDYPSIALLHQKIKEKKVNIIFAVTRSNQRLYQQLTDALPDVSTAVGVLATDSSNIVTLIEEEYGKIAEKIIMVDNANASMGLRLSYRSTCVDGRTLMDTNTCDGVKVGDEVEFEVTLDALHCVPQRDFELHIGPSGLEEVLKLYVHVICDCDCEDEIVYNAPECNGHGNLVCGICQCAEGFVGTHCECESGGESAVALEAKCKTDTDSLVCSGRGICKCGTGPYNETRCSECPFTVIPVDELPVLNINESDSWNECQFVDPADDCTFYFLYYYDGMDNLTVWVREHKDCPAPLPVLVIVLIVIAGIVLLGLLLLLLWKLMTLIYDRREYARFEKDRLQARWDTNENPLYKQATTTFKNPVYAGDAAKNK